MRCILHVYFQNRSLPSVKIQQNTAISNILQLAVIYMSIFYTHKQYTWKYRILVKYILLINFHMRAL
jgi:hypothetical protein